MKVGENEKQVLRFSQDDNQENTGWPKTGSCSVTKSRLGMWLPHFATLFLATKLETTQVGFVILSRVTEHREGARRRTSFSFGDAP